MLMRMMLRKFPTAILGLAAVAALAQQRPNQPQGPQSGMWEIVPVKSNVIQRGDVEILTFETPESLDRLESL